MAVRPDQSQCFQVAVGLHAGPEYREYRGVRAGELLGGHGRCGRRPHLGDQPPVHHGERLAGFGPEQHDHRVMGMDALVVGIEGDQLGAERTGIRRHDGEEASVRSNREDRAHRLDNAATRQVGERTRNGGNELLVMEQPLDGALIEDDDGLLAHETRFAVRL